MKSIDTHGKLTVKDLRLRAKKTQAQVAEDVGITRRNIAAWEKGGIVPTLDKAVRFAVSVNASMSEICSAFGVDVSGLKSDVSQESQESPPASDDKNTSIAARLLANKTQEELEALFSFFSNKNDGGLAPPSQ